MKITTVASGQIFWHWQTSYWTLFVKVTFPVEMMVYISWSIYDILTAVDR